MTPDNDELTAADRDALKRALALAQAESEGRREQLARMQRENGWFAAAHFACYSRQIDALGLKPWQDPPCYGHLGDDADATALAQRLEAAGLSIFEPDPAGALARIEARAQREPPAA
jgi:hypothetical protein